MSIPLNLYLTLASRYGGSSESDGKSNRVRVQNDKAAAHYYDHIAALKSLLSAVMKHKRGDV